MAGARDHRDQNDDRSPVGLAGGTRRAPDHDLAPAIAGSADPRLAHGGAEAGLMHLQRTAGNAAVSSLVSPPVQRAVEIDEITSEVDTAAPEPGGDASAGPVTSDGGATTISGSQIHLDAPMVDAPGVVRVGTIIADNVVGSNYTPGAGNIW
jgi:hypothetical protein